MVVLASAITSKTGKALLSRQFVEMSRSRIEGLLAAFPKLMGTEKEHTFVEADNVRYVYQPLENLYIVVVTNTASNILEDLETLHLLAKIIPEYCHLLEEKEVLKHAFEIIFAFDEVVAMGYKERVNLMQIKHFLSMESHDELRIKQEMIAKVVEAKKEADRQRRMIDKKKMEDRKLGIGYDSGSISNSYNSPGASQRSTFAQEPIVESKRESPKPAPRSVKGLQLGKGKKTSGYAKVLQEENVVDTTDTPIGVAPVVEPVSHEQVHVQTFEKITLVAEGDGALKSMEVKGELIVTAYDPKFSQMQVHILPGENKEFQFKAHPNIERNLYERENILALKASKSYPRATPSSILKWRWATAEEKNIPLTINVWPSSSSGETTVPVEYEKNCSFDLKNVVVSIPIPGGSGPIVGELVGNYDYDAKKNLLHWRIPLIDDSNRTGSMEFTVPQSSATGFFPVSVSFTADTTYCGIKTVAVTAGENDVAEFSTETQLSVDEYTIE